MDGYIIIGTELETKSFDAQIKYVEARLLEIEKSFEQADLGMEVGDTLKLEAEYEKLIGQLGKLKVKKEEADSVDLGNTIRDLEDTDKKTGNVIKKMGKWALALFAVQTAYGAIRKAISTVSGMNEQIKTDIDYMTFAIATALEPVIEMVVQVALKLLAVIGSIVNALFGVNVFANASVDAFKSANSAAKTLKKTIAGFDELNIVSDTGGVSTATPSLDLSTLTDEGEKAKNFWTEIFAFWDTEWENWFVGQEGNWGAFIEGIGTFLKGFVDIFTGVFQIITGLFQFFVALFQGDTEAMQLAWEKMVEGFKNLFFGLLEVIVGAILIVLGTIKGLFLDIVQGIYNSVILPVGRWFKNLWNNIADGARIAWYKTKSAFASVGSFFSGVFSKIRSIFYNIGQKIGSVISSAFKGAINAALYAAERVINTPIRAINKLLGVINGIPGINLRRLNSVYLPRLATGGIINYPSRGVPVGAGSAIGGEAGAEGVIPLTDSQAMETLGAAIGRYITINATIENSMNGRVLSREIKKINGNDDFAMNR